MTLCNFSLFLFDGEEWNKSAGVYFRGGRFLPLASPYQIGANIDYHAFRGRDMFKISLKGKVAQQVICTTSIPKLYEL